MRTEDEIQEQFEAFKKLIGDMDIGAFRTLDVDRLISDYMSGELEIKDDEVPRRELGVPIWIIVSAVALWALL